MGFLRVSEPLTWEEQTEQGHLHRVRENGIEQFIHTFLNVRTISDDLFRFGDEVEYMLLALDGEPESAERTTKVSLHAHERIEAVKALEQHGRTYGLSESDMSTWMPEYGAFMIEGCPGKPFEGVIDLGNVEERMRVRRSRLMSVLAPNEVISTLTTFPLLGVGDFCSPSQPVGGKISESIFVPDAVITNHPRFHTLTRNIRCRRKRKVLIKRPKFIDERTARPKVRQLAPTEEPSPKTPEEADQLPFVYGDAMVFGMGCNCLQVTFQAADLAESRHLYDHLAVLAPLLMALTAASPIMRGWLLNEDCRWDSVSMSVDDRTKAEMGQTDSQDGDERMAGKGTRFLRKSRYSSIDCYLCNCQNGRLPGKSARMFSDIEVPIDKPFFNRLTAAGVDEIMAQHVAHLFVRDPLVIFKDRVHLDNRFDSDHWENIQSTNWQSVRWKPPPVLKGQKDRDHGQHIGWRVEFRTMEAQITDFENAAFTAFVVLLSRVILALDLNLYIPISKMEENMAIAHKRNAAVDEKFWFPNHLLPPDLACDNYYSHGCEREVTQLTLREILLGTHRDMGLVPLCRTYLDFIGCDSTTRAKLERYMSFIVKRATGELPTPATWIRNFVRSHPSYQKDSRVPADIAHDLVRKTARIAQGEEACPEFLGEFTIDPIKPAHAHAAMETVSRKATVRTRSRSVGTVSERSRSPSPSPRGACQVATSQSVINKLVNRDVAKHQAKLRAELTAARAELEETQARVRELEKRFVQP